jgi:hypothetical protein
MAQKMSGELPGERHKLPAEFFDPQPKPDGRRNNGGARAGAGQTPVHRTAATIAFRKKMQAHGGELIEALMSIVRSGEPDAVRLEAIRLGLERAYGKVQLDDSGNVAAVANVFVNTGCKG